MKLSTKNHAALTDITHGRVLAMRERVGTYWPDTVTVTVDMVIAMGMAALREAMDSANAETLAKTDKAIQAVIPGLELMRLLLAVEPKVDY